MSKPVLELNQGAHEAFYAFIGRVSLELVEHNVDAITAANFLRAGQAFSAPAASVLEQRTTPVRSRRETKPVPPAAHDASQPPNAATG